MSSHRVVVDGSNIATEGRSLPSLVQLDEAVRAYREEHPDAEIIVVVDATFAHRIHESEREMFEEAAAHNELVYPPAGAIGRGDAFLLRIADKTDAVVLSNDSFQEFHGEFEWLFTKGRLIGGTPVPGVGWIFVPRTPVRGPKSREAVKEAKRGKARIGSKDASLPMPVPKSPPPGRAPRNKNAKGGDTAKPPKQEALKAAIDEATEEAVEAELDVGGGGGGGGRKRRRKRKSGGASALPTVNEPLTFIEFIAEHQPGATVEGEIESFASHGAFVVVGDARCYIPLSAMGDPPPRAAREVLNRGETRTFVVQALDAPRRGIELALPGFERIAGKPTDETVEAEIEEAPPPITAKKSRGGRKAAARAAAEADLEAAGDAAADGEPAVPARVGRGVRKAAKKAMDVVETVQEAVVDAVEPEKKKRTTRKSAKKSDAGEAETPELVDEAPPAKKAAARRAAVKKAAAEELSASAPAEGADAPASPRATTAKKKATRTAKAAATPAPVPATSTEPPAPADVDGTVAAPVKKKAAAAAAKVATTKAAARGRAAEATGPAPAPAPGSAEAAAAPAPAKKARASTKKAATSTSSEEAAPAAPATKKGAARKQAATEPAATEPAATKKKAAPRKAAAGKAAAEKAGTKSAGTKAAAPKKATAAKKAAKKATWSPSS